jgi:hypothetical protein
MFLARARCAPLRTTDAARLAPPGSYTIKAAAM